MIVYLLSGIHQSLPERHDSAPMGSGGYLTGQQVDLAECRGDGYTPQQTRHVFEGPVLTELNIRHGEEVRQDPTEQEEQHGLLPS